MPHGATFHDPIDLTGRYIDDDEQAPRPSEEYKNVREFDTGATRDTDEGKIDYEGFLSPVVLEEFGTYMHKHRVQSDGTLRDSDNWQKGIPLDAYMKSGFRHFMEWWVMHRRRGREGYDAEWQVEHLTALLFNVQGYLHELLSGTEHWEEHDGGPDSD